MRKVGLKSVEACKEWNKSGQRPSNIPSCPAQAYRNAGWVSFPDWLGYKGRGPLGQMLPFKRAREIVRKLGLKSAREWEECRRKSGQRPTNISSHPAKAYRNDGWVSWPDWLGYGIGRPPRSRGKGKRRCGTRHTGGNRR